MTAKSDGMLMPFTWIQSWNAFTKLKSKDPNNLFQENITSGMGFIAVALVYFGSWRPFGVLAGALLFSMVNALQLWIQVLGIPIPSELAVMMPYILTILVLALSLSKGKGPSALTKAFEREG